jgi:hypothetical protein
MRRYLGPVLVCSVVLACCAMLAPTAMGQAPSAVDGLLDPGPVPSSIEAQRKIDYERSTAAVTPRMIVQQKAQSRAADRMARIAALEWYGHSKARPQSSATPFSGMYGDQFQGSSFGRPNAWHAARPVILMVR